MNTHTDMTIICAELENWWEHGDQKNPLIQISIPREHAQGLIPDTDDLTRFWTDVDFVIDRQMKALESTDYYGIAVPFHYVNHGSSAMAGALGARMEYVDKRTIWAHPVLDSIDQVAEVILDPDNLSYRTILEITRRSVALSKDHHFVTPYAMEGAGDIVAGLYGTESLLIDFIARPQAVKRAMEHIKRIWLEAFDEIWRMIARGGNPGGGGWAGVWSPGTTFPMQEDFSYMISPEMFREFCLPHIVDQVDAMDYAFYHLDGVGAIPHLDALLNIPNLRVIQWVPGIGEEEIKQWYPLIRRILAANKSVQVFTTVDEVDDLVRGVGAKGLLISCGDASREEAERLVEKYGN